MRFPDTVKAGDDSDIWCGFAGNEVSVAMSVTRASRKMGCDNNLWLVSICDVAEVVETTVLVVAKPTRLRNVS